MDKFSKINTTKKQTNDNILFKNDNIEIISNGGVEFINEKDEVIILPYLKDEGNLLIMSDVNLSWLYKHRSENLPKNTNFLTMINGKVEKNEIIKQTIRRVMYDNAGLVLSEFYNFNVSGPFFKSSNNTSQFYVCLLDVRYNDFKIVTSKNNLKKIIKLSIGDLENIKINDMASALLLEKLKNEK